MKKYLLSFCDTKLIFTLCRIQLEAMMSHCYDQVVTVSENQFDNEFWEKHKWFFRTNPKGYGFGIWRYYFISKMLDQIQDNDILVYVDGGCSINTRAKDRLEEYFKFVSESDSGLLVFESNLVQKEYTKSDVFRYMDATDAKYTDSKLYLTSTMVIRKCPNTIKIFSEMYSIVDKQLYYLFDNNPGIIPDDSIFKGSKNDASIFSLVVKQNCAVVLPDETSKESYQQSGDKIPIWNTRLHY